MPQRGREAPLYKKVELTWVPTTRLGLEQTENCQSFRILEEPFLYYAHQKPWQEFPGFLPVSTICLGFTTNPKTRFLEITPQPQKPSCKNTAHGARCFICAYRNH